MTGRRILLPALMALALALIIVPFAAEKAYADTDQGGVWEFEPINANYARVTDCLDKDIVNAVIPETVGDGIGPQYIVTAVGSPGGDQVFNECYDLATVKIPNSVYRIEDFSLSWPGEMTSITFDGNHLQYIGANAFSNTGITGFQIPSTVTYIGDWAFSGCTELKSIKIPSGVTRIGSGTFSGSGLTSVTIPSSVKSIGGEAFSGTGLTSLVIPSSVTSIGGNAFSECSALRSLSLPAGLKTIPTEMCLACSSLTSVTIPSGVTSIGEMAFAECGLTSVTIPNSVTSVGESAFWSDTKLKSIVLSNNMKAIPAEMCDGCRALTSVTIPSGVTSIGAAAFDHCSALATVTIPVSVRKIGDSAFFGSGLKKVIYAGSQAQWKKIAIGAYNDELLSAAKVFKGEAAKKANPLTAKAKTVTVKYKKVKKKNQMVKRSKAIKVSKAQGKVSYKLVSVKKAKFKKYFKVNAKNGNITVKKKIKKGTYKVKIKVTAAGNAGFRSGSKTVTVTVKVK